MTENAPSSNCAAAPSLAWEPSSDRAERDVVQHRQLPAGPWTAPVSILPCAARVFTRDLQPLNYRHGLVLLRTFDAQMFQTLAEVGPLERLDVRDAHPADRSHESADEARLCDGHSGDLARF